MSLAHITGVFHCAQRLTETYFLMNNERPDPVHVQGGGQEARSKSPEDWEISSFGRDDRRFRKNSRLKPLLPLCGWDGF